MNVERFRWHNLQWLEMVADSNNVTSNDSVVSDSPDICNEVFGAEDILGDASPDISLTNANNDF